MAPIAGTADDPLFRDRRWDADGFSYEFDVGTGDYVLLLRLAETALEAAGERVFDVAAEDQEPIGDLDILARVGGNAALDIALPVTVADRQLNIDFLEQVGAPALSAMRLMHTAPGAIVVINVGGPAYLAADGTLYQADFGFTGGSSARRAVEIPRTIDDALYHDERWSPTGFGYDLELDNGWYLVELHFAETFYTDYDKRAFDVALEGQVRIDDLNIFDRTYGTGTLDFRLAVEVTDGQLDLDLLPVIGSPILNAFRATSLGAFDIA